MSHVQVLQLHLFISIYLAVDWFFGDKGIYVPLWNFIVGNIFKSILCVVSDQQCVNFYLCIALLSFKSDRCSVNVGMKSGPGGGRRPRSVVFVGRLSQSSWNVTFPHSPARTECKYIVSLYIRRERAQQNSTDVFSCLRTRRKMHSFILFSIHFPPASCHSRTSVKCHRHLQLSSHLRRLRLQQFKKNVFITSIYLTPLSSWTLFYL